MMNDQNLPSPDILNFISILYIKSSNICRVRIICCISQNFVLLLLFYEAALHSSIVLYYISIQTFVRALTKINKFPAEQD